jgi:uncharacterized protein YndB with AHSA1/START domain
MDVYFEQHYPHPIDKVWRALTNSEALAQWLMENDFEPQIGRECVFRFCAADSDDESLVYVTVEKLDPPRLMQWQWRNEDEQRSSTVIFELEATDGGTLLKLRHRGPVSPRLAEGLKRGWPVKLADIETQLT